MSKAVAWEGNVYSEMESEQATGAGLYDDLVGGCEIPGTKQTCPEKHVAEKSEQISTEPTNSNSPSEAVMLRRLLCIIVAVVAVCFLISAVTLILVLMMMISARSSPITSTDRSGDAVQSKLIKIETKYDLHSIEGFEKCRKIIRLRAVPSVSFLFNYTFRKLIRYRVSRVSKTRGNSNISCLSSTGRKLTLISRFGTWNLSFELSK